MLNSISRTPAFKSLLLDKEEAKTLPKSMQEELKPGKITSSYSLSQCVFPKFKVTNGDKKYFISPDGHAEKLEGKVILDAIKPKFAVQDNKVFYKPKKEAEKLLQQELYDKDNVVLGFSKDENIVDADEVVEV